MAFASNLKTRNCVVWEIETPFVVSHCVSPVFTFMNSRCYFLISQKQYPEKCDIRVSFRYMFMECPPFDVTVHIESSKKGGVPLLCKRTTVSNPCSEIWCADKEAILKEMPDFESYGHFNIVCAFHVSTESTLQIEKEKGIEITDGFKFSPPVPSSVSTTSSPVITSFKCDTTPNESQRATTSSGFEFGGLLSVNSSLNSGVSPAVVKTSASIVSTPSSRYAVTPSESQTATTTSSFGLSFPLSVESSVSSTVPTTVVKSSTSTVSTPSFRYGIAQSESQTATTTTSFGFGFALSANSSLSSSSTSTVTSSFKCGITPIESQTATTASGFKYSVPITVNSPISSADFTAVKRTSEPSYLPQSVSTSVASSTTENKQPEQTSCTFSWEKPQTSIDLKEHKSSPELTAEPLKDKPESKVFNSAKDSCLIKTPDSTKPTKVALDITNSLLVGNNSEGTLSNTMIASIFSDNNVPKEKEIPSSECFDSITHPVQSETNENRISSIFHVGSESRTLSTLTPPVVNNSSSDIAISKEEKVPLSANGDSLTQPVQSATKDADENKISSIFHLRSESQSLPDFAHPINHFEYKETTNSTKINLSMNSVTLSTATSSNTSKFESVTNLKANEASSSLLNLFPTPAKSEESKLSASTPSPSFISTNNFPFGSHFTTSVPSSFSSSSMSAVTSSVFSFSSTQMPKSTAPTYSSGRIFRKPRYRSSEHKSIQVSLDPLLTLDTLPSDTRNLSRSSSLTSLESLDSLLNLESLSQDLANLLDQNVIPDVQLKSKDRTIPAHRAILAARSEVFSEKFRHQTAKSSKEIIDINDIEPAVLDMFLKYMYSGKVPNDLSESTIVKLYEASDKYSVCVLTKICSDFMIKNISEENFLKFLTLADTHSDKDLKEAVARFITKRDQLLTSDIWISFSDEHPRLANQIYQKYIEKCLSKETSQKKIM